METKPVTVAVVDQEESWGMTAKVGGGFIIGLLLGIGGTWLVMHNANGTDADDNDANASTTEGVITGTNGGTSTNGGGTVSTGTNGGSTTVSGISDSSFSVADQKAGNSVAVGKVSFGQNGGWVVIRDDVNGKPGPRILGASWFPQGNSTNVAVPLLRNTEAGKKYHALLHSDNGNKQYSTADDKPVLSGNNQIEAVFTAQ